MKKDINNTRTSTRKAILGLLLLAATLLPAGRVAGQTVVVHGSVFGGGAGASSDKTLAVVEGNTNVEIDTGWVKENVYGGGELATVGTFTYDATTGLPTARTSGGKTTVSVSGGMVGTTDMAMVHKDASGNVLDDDGNTVSLNDDGTLADGTHRPKAPDFRGHVFGGGKGTVDGYTEGDNMIPSLAFVYVTDVTISGTALVCGSVYGGSENGHIFDSTYVKIAGGQIGVGQGVGRAYTDDEWASGTYNSDSMPECAHWDYIDGVDEDNDAGKNCPYDMYESVSGWTSLSNYTDVKAGRAVATDGHTFYGNVFGGGSGYFPYAPGKWLRSAGNVGGNTRVEITGGHILTSVYGGNELTNVGCGDDGLTSTTGKGTCTVKMQGGTVGVPRNNPRLHPVTCNLYGAGKGDQRTAFNQWTNVDSTHVEVTDGRVYGSVFGGGEDGHVLRNTSTTISGSATIIGTKGNSEVDGNVFGGGRGFSATALTAGVVCGNVDLTIQGGSIYGSVYGGGRLASVGTPLVQPENATYGHIQAGTTHGNITVTITGGTIGNEEHMSTTYSMGDVFGGGKGTALTNNMNSNQRLGLSKNTNVSISGASTRVLGNVYGGGELASVGDYTYATATEATDYNKKNPGYGMKEYDVLKCNTSASEEIGLAVVSITGGLIGIEGKIADAARDTGHTVNRKGHVYGGCLGKSEGAYSGYSFVNIAHVTIGGTAADSARIVGSVFGGGENGHVMDSTRVRVEHGLVGMELEDIVDADTLTSKSEHYEHNGQGFEIYFGNVYGGGRGIEKASDLDDYSPSSGRVYGNTNVLITGGRVTHNVYGGGSLANTGYPTYPTSGLATVAIKGNAVIGYNNTDDDDYYIKAGHNEGRVYGSARGQAAGSGGTLTSMAFTKNTNVTIGGQAQVKGSVFGGGENGHVRKNTYVHITDTCRIGVPLEGTTEGGDHWENPVTGVGPTIYRGNVYGGGRGLDSYTYTVKDSKGNDSTAYGLSLTAGRVYGNATVDIDGDAIIYHHIYGGGSLASVGDTIHLLVTQQMIDTSTDATFKATYPKAGPYDILDSIISGDYTFRASNNKTPYTNTTAYDTALYYKDTTRTYRVGDPIGGTGLVTINVSGGQIGENGINEGRIYGSGRGIAGANTSQYTHMAFTHNTVVNISDSADIRGCVFGGGANGHVTQNTQVNVSGGTIGTRLTYDDRMIAANGAPLHSIYRGNVYGGGRGVDNIGNSTALSTTAGQVFGNTEVNVSGGLIRHSVFGGGSLASVGKFILANYGSEEEPDLKHLYYEGTGQAIIHMTGGTIGPRIDATDNDLSYNVAGTKLSGSTEAELDTIRKNYHYLGANEGMVYGSGRGVAYLTDDKDENHKQYIEMAFTYNTLVDISGGNVYGSVFGGGENGHVRRDTDVRIRGNAIVGGIPLHGAGAYALPDGRSITFKDTVRAGDTIKDYGDNELAEDEHGVGLTVYRGNVYGGGRGVDNSGTTSAASAEYSASAGRVYGNTNVLVSGKANVYRAVFGGGSVASVGRYLEDANGPYAPDSMSHIVEDLTEPVGYRLVDRLTTGRTNVRIEGGVIGQTGRNEGHVYGGGRGIAGSQTAAVTHLAYCDSTTVLITYSDSTEADIRGSVFGGGANGHVLRNTSVVMNSGIVGTRLDLAERSINSGAVGSRIYRGNLYGGGRGVDPYDNSAHLSATAGRVYGNTNVVVRGGTVRHNVYGGGSLASVGTFREVDNNLNIIENDYYDFKGYITHAYLKGTGEAHVTILGGRIGPTANDLLYNNGNTTDGEVSQTVLNDNFACLGENEGQVYGSGRGVAYTIQDSNAAYAELAFVKETYVRIDSVAFVCGSVFGGGENGHVRFDTHVDIDGDCLIGGIPLHDTNGYNLTKSRFAPGVDRTVKFNIPETTAKGGKIVDSMAYKNTVELYELPTGVGRTMYRGNVYGGGRGIDHTSIQGEGNGYSSSAGRVYGNVNLNIVGGHILHHVYGGGSIASVGNYEYMPAPDSLTPTHPRAAKYGFEYNTRKFELTDTTQRAISGTINVNVKGGVIGITGINEGRVYTAGRGIAGARTAQITHLAYSNTTHLLVDSVADIRGSVFGGGANGHVLEDALVEVKAGTIGWGIAYHSDKSTLGITPDVWDSTDYRGNTWRTDPYNLIDYDLEKDMAQYVDTNADGTTATLFRGNVYGGGRGVDPAGGGDLLSATAGRIFGNVKIDVTGGSILHNIYGGGSLASVGDTHAISATYPADADGFGQWNDTTGFVDLHVGGNARVGWNGIDNNGQVYGSCRGEVADLATTVGLEYARMAYVYRTEVKVDGNARIMGSVLGGGANGHVMDSAVVIISGGEVGRLATSKLDYDPRYQFCGNVYGAGRGVDVTSGNFTRLAQHAGNVRGNTRVVVSDSARIYRNVYGGGSLGIVGNYGSEGDLDTVVGWTEGVEPASGRATVQIYGTVGDSAMASWGYGGDVYGSSRGKGDGIQDTVYDDMAYVYTSHVQLLSPQAKVWGSVYGGGENGHVDVGGTNVVIAEGCVKGDVFGGGKGTRGIPTAGVVDGSARVSIGTAAQASNSVVIEGNVYGGNNANSSPLDSTVVHIYKTAHTAGVNDTSAAARATNLKSNYALANVFGGGNEASRLEDSIAYYTARPKTKARKESYDATALALVYVHGCDNTVQRVFGGGNAADVPGSKVMLEGGRFDTVFAGGNGEVTAANVGLGGTSGQVMGGIVNYLFSGSNKKGSIAGTSSVEIDTTGGANCEFEIENLFGGGNEAAAGGGEVTINCGTHFENFYGGANNADINGDITLNVNGGEFVNLFGGNNRGGTVSGNITVNVNGGSIQNLFGGNNLGGSVLGTITINVDHDYEGNTCAEGIRLDTIYGGGKMAAYSPSAANSATSPLVNLITDTITRAVFGGGLGADAKVLSNPKVVIGDEGHTQTTNPVIVRGSVYGGGSAAPVGEDGSEYTPWVRMNRGVVVGNIFGGGLGKEAVVTGDTKVHVRGLSTVEQNVYGGGSAGEVSGNTEVIIGDEE